MNKLIKILFATAILATNVAYADVVDFKITQQNFYCKPKQNCNVYTDFDATIVNETDISHHYNLLFGLELENPTRAWTSGDSFDVPPRGTITKHYHHVWQSFRLDVSNSYLLKGSIRVINKPETIKETMTTVWVY